MTEELQNIWRSQFKWGWSEMNPLKTGHIFVYRKRKNQPRLLPRTAIAFSHLQLLALTNFSLSFKSKPLFWALGRKAITRIYSTYVTTFTFVKTGEEITAVRTWMVVQKNSGPGCWELPSDIHSALRIDKLMLEATMNTQRHHFPLAK